jgi:hypothetical protein
VSWAVEDATSVAIDGNELTLFDVNGVESMQLEHT